MSLVTSKEQAESSSGSSLENGLLSQSNKVVDPQESKAVEPEQKPVPDPPVAAKPASVDAEKSGGEERVQDAASAAASPKSKQVKESDSQPQSSSDPKSQEPNQDVQSNHKHSNTTTTTTTTSSEGSAVALPPSNSNTATLNPTDTQPSTSNSTSSHQPSFSNNPSSSQSIKEEDLDNIETHDHEWEEGSEEALDQDANQHQEEEEQRPIQAYAKLEFPGFSYYVQTLEVSIGRRPAHLPNDNSSQSQHLTGTPLAPGDVDVDLGPLKSISRLHAKIYYQPAGSNSTNLHNPVNLDLTRNFSYLNHHNASNGYDPNAGVAPSATHSNRNSPTPSGIDTPANYGWGNGPMGGEGRFVLELMGRNGAFVDDVWVGKGGVVPLGRR